MKSITLLLPESTLPALGKLAQSVGGSLEQYCSALLTEVAENAKQSLNNWTSARTDDSISTPLPDTVLQVLAICRYVWIEHLDFRNAVPKVASDFSVLSTTVRDKCTRRISFGDVQIDTDDFLTLLAQPETLRDHLCQKFPEHKAEITQRFNELISERKTSPVSQSKRGPVLKPAKRVKEQELIDQLVAHLKTRGGSAPKGEVEQALFEFFKDTLQDPFYGESVGGGVPRWKKNVQFARNTARERGLIKNESERGIWELTEKGWQ